jgi:hypothetical protein
MPRGISAKKPAAVGSSGFAEVIVVETPPKAVKPSGMPTVPIGAVGWLETTKSAALSCVLSVSVIVKLCRPPGRQ